MNESPSGSEKRAKRFELPIIPKRHNSLNWAHWATKHREKQRWTTAILTLPRGPWIKHPLDGTLKQRVRIGILVYRKAIQDPDNAVASCKYLVDALVRRGWAVDDTKEWLDCRVSEEVDRKNTRTVIFWEVL